MRVKPLVKLDMDGCVSGFTEGVMRHFGNNLPREQWEWDVAKPNGFRDINDPEFWKHLSNAVFWSELPFLSDGIDLAARLFTLEQKGVIELAICTSAAVPGSMDGKQVWLSRYLPYIKKREFVVGGKAHCGGPGMILIDDNDENVEKWRAVGGMSVLIPRPWNKNRDLTTNGYDFNPNTVYEAIVNAVTKSVRKCNACGSLRVD